MPGREREGGIPFLGDDAVGADAMTYDALLSQFRDELAHRTGDSDSGSGVPRAAFGPRPAKPKPPVRDFTLGGSEPPGTGHDGTGHFERHPQLMMLFTNRDEPADWLRAGQALQRALLTATSLGVSTSFLTQPLELADLAFRDDPRLGRMRRPPGLTGHSGLTVRRHVDASQRNSSSHVDRRGYARRHLLGATPWLEVPQMVIRVGYPKNQPGKDIRTPRREPDVTDARSGPPVRVAWPPAGSSPPAGSQRGIRFPA